MLSTHSLRESGTCKTPETAPPGLPKSVLPGGREGTCSARSPNSDSKVLGSISADIVAAPELVGFMPRVSAMSCTRLTPAGDRHSLRRRIWSLITPRLGSYRPAILAGCPSRRSHSFPCKATAKARVHYAKTSVRWITPPLKRLNNFLFVDCASHLSNYSDNSLSLRIDLPSKRLFLH
jgi:hypothetical protein